jgi:plastocyanin domain-containing protein
LNTTDWLIIAAGLGAAAWVTWYFFLAERGTASTARAATTVKGEQEVRITVHGGYEPATVRVAAGKPVRLLFDRQETATCSEELVFPAFGLRKFLPAHQTTTLEVTPPSPGTYEFTCGMGMLHGRLVAE